MDQDFQELIDGFYQVTGRINKLRNKQFSFAGTVPLNTAALHLIDLIGRHPDYNLTQLATTLGNTKGAVSQLASKLVAKNLISRRQTPGNEKVVTFALTAAGRQVFAGHQQLHAQLYQQLETILATFSPAERAKLKQALAAIDDCLTDYGKQE